MRTVGRLLIVLLLLCTGCGSSGQMAESEKEKVQREDEVSLKFSIWSDEESYSWCFDGEPKHSTVAVSSVGTQVSKESSRLFMNGYNEMLERLEPSAIIMYGKVPDGCEGNIIPVGAFQQKWRNKQET